MPVEPPHKVAVSFHSKHCAPKTKRERERERERERKMAELDQNVHIHLVILLRFNVKMLGLIVKILDLFKEAGK